MPLYSNEIEAKKYWDLYLNSVENPNFLILFECYYWPLDSQTPPPVLVVCPPRILQAQPLDYQSPRRLGQGQKT